MSYKSIETCHPVSLPCKGTNILMFVTCGASFYLWVWSVQPIKYNLYTCGLDVFTCKNVLCTHSYIFYSHGCNKFLHARTFFTLAHTILFKCWYIFYSHGCNVRAWNLFWASVAKPVFWPLMMLLACTLTPTSSIPMGAINFYVQECFLHLLIPLVFPCSYVFYSHGCNVRAWNLFWASVAKPVLWQWWFYSIQ